MRTVQSAWLILSLASFQTGPSFGQVGPQETLQQGRKPLGVIDDPDRFWIFARQNEDVGILELVKRYSPPPVLTLSTFQSAFYSDNVNFTETGRRSSVAWEGEFRVTYVPYSSYRWTPRLDLEQYMFRYAREPSRDFNAQIPTLSSRLDLTEDKSLYWDFSYSLWRLTAAHGTDNEIYKHGELENQLSWLRLISREHSLSFLGSYAIAWRHAHPSFLDRVDNKVTLGLDYSPIEQIEILSYLRAEIRCYTTDNATQHDRRDLCLRPGVICVWTPIRNLSVGADLLWAGNYSNTDGQDFQVFRPSVAVFGAIGF